MKWCATARHTHFGKADVARGVGDFYSEHGYAIVRDALTRVELDAIERETLSLCRGELGGVHGHTPPEAGATDDEVLRGVLCVHHPHRASDLFLEMLAQPAIVQVPAGAVVSSTATRSIARSRTTHRSDATGARS